VGNETRIDKWLWAVRLFKTRTLAANACRNGQVLINGQRLKPARDVHTGEIIVAKTGVIQRTVKVLAFPPNRIAAKLVPEFLEDLTPASEYEKAREAKRPPPQFTWSKGHGRPTKKSRRLWEKWGGEEEVRQ
jgi:ribosome-associated heat shock protein Hsp15